MHVQPGQPGIFVHIARAEPDQIPDDIGCLLTILKTTKSITHSFENDCLSICLINKGDNSSVRILHFLFGILTFSFLMWEASQ